MCTQCVAQAVPAVAVAAGGLRAMAWNAKQRTLRRGLPPIQRSDSSTAPADTTTPPVVAGTIKS